MKSCFPRRHGAALIITLAMIAMMTFLVVAFFSRALTNLQVETASTGTVRADLLARSAGGIIISDFRTEIIAGSTASGSSGQAPVYQPKTPATAVPIVSRVAGTSIGVPEPFVNLVKQSTGPFFPNAAPYNTGSNLRPIIQTVTPTYTDTVSPNGRKVVKERWDLAPSPYTPGAPPLYPSGFGPLLVINNAPAIGYSHYYTSAMLPRWVMMTRDGVPAVQDSPSIPVTWRDYTPTNTSAAIGRFAYNIYNVGGLLDVNAVGYDESAGAVPLTAVGQKGTPGFAKLSVIPGMGSSPAVNATAFAKTWRNLASGNSVDNYLAYLGFTRNATNALLTGNPLFSKGPGTGFLQTAVSTSSSDNRVLGRQDLIRLATKLGSPYGLTAASLPYLTHFSREVNAPSWGPTQNALDMGGNNGSGSPVPYAYLNNKDNALVPNRFFTNVRVGSNPIPGGWRRLTGEYAVEGEPLVKYRFPLSWLLVLQNADPTSPNWGLTEEAKAIVRALHDRNVANGGPGIGGNDNEKAAYLALHAFGLVWIPTDISSPQFPYPTNLGGHWNYVGSKGSSTTVVAERIALLGESGTPPPSTSPPTPTPVCRDSREPNFFELLKAGILKGSLGNASDFESMCVSAGEDSNADYQVMQIGTNMIDQADSDSYPTRIVFGYRFDNPTSIVSARAPLYASGNTTPYTTPKELRVISGVEDLPYIYTFLSTPYRIPAGQPILSGMPLPIMPPNTVPTNLQTPQRDALDAWLQFVLWKPQQKAVATTAPSKFRILFSGTDVHLTIFGKKDPPYDNFGQVDFKYKDTDPILASPASAPDKWVTFTDAIDDFRTPTLLGGMSAETSTGSGISPNPSVKPPNDFDCSQAQGKGYHPTPASATAPVPLPRGLWLGEMYRPEYSTQTTNPAPKGYTSYQLAPATQHSEFRCESDSKFELQYDQDGNGHWRTYQRYDRFGVGTGSHNNYGGRPLYGYADQIPGTPLSNSPVYTSSNPPAYKALDISTLAIGAVDPRSHRYGLLAQSVGDPNNVAIWPNSSQANWKYYLKQGWAPKSSGPYYMTFGPNSADGRFSPNWTGGTASNPWLTHSTDNIVQDPEGFWADDSTTGVFCKDPDLVQRRADGDNTNGVRPIEQTLATGYTVPSTPSTAARSQDLGRVLNRPFRSVGELGYVFRDEPYKSLNLFTDKSADSALLDIFSVTEQPAIVAGKVNLNTRSPEILQALIVAASREELSTANTISTAEALNIANLLVANTAAAPGLNSGPLMNPAEIANRMAKILPVGGTDPNANIKARREVVGRALAGSGQTRTWNFLVDVIAQSGRFGPAATTPSQFIVEGEKRYWLHVAIDRFTGQVVDQQLEPVVE